MAHDVELQDLDDKMKAKAAEQSAGKTGKGKKPRTRNPLGTQRLSSTMAQGMRKPLGSFRSH
jgi:hypothetical protein